MLSVSLHCSKFKIALTTIRIYHGSCFHQIRNIYKTIISNAGVETNLPPSINNLIHPISDLLHFLLIKISVFLIFCEYFEINIYNFNLIYNFLSFISSFSLQDNIDMSTGDFIRVRIYQTKTRRF